MTLEKLKNIRLSEHFRANEIFYSKEFKTITLSSDYKLRKAQLFLAEALCRDIDEHIRKEAGSPMIITGGARNTKTHLLMKKLNPVPPSPHSDHSFMNFYWSLGVGANDFIIKGFALYEMRHLFEWIVRNMAEYKSHIGQVIFYPQNGGFIHISNPPDILGDVGSLFRRDIANINMQYYNGHYVPYL